MKTINLSIVRVAFVLLSAIMLSACSSSNSSNASTMNNKEEGAPIIFTAVGYAPIASQHGRTLDLKILNAIKASKIEAYKELAEQIYGVSLTSKNSLVGSQLKKDVVNSNVTGIIRGASVKRSYHKGAFYITELELNMNIMPVVMSLNVASKRRSVTKVTSSQVYY